MAPDSEQIEAGGRKRVRVARRKRRIAEADSQQTAPAARVLQLVAAIKAEHHATGGEGADNTTGERARLFTWLRRLMVAREQERAQWRDQTLRVKAELFEARAEAERRRAELDQAVAQHQRMLADLKLLHEHQRSIWQLERRRFEITVESYEQGRRGRFPARLRRLIARPAPVAALLLASVVAIALVRDSGHGAFRFYLDDARRLFFAADQRTVAVPIFDARRRERILPPR